jgi:hypothetical protein
MQVRFTMEDPTGVCDFLNDSTEGVYWLDANAGLLTRLEMTHYSGRERRKRTIRCELAGREQMDSAWLERRRLELVRFIRAQQIEDGLHDELGTHPERVNGTIRRSEHLWGEYLVQPPRDESSPLRRVAEACERRARALAPALRERAALASEWIGAPAAQWSLQDMNGGTVTSETVRKGVTVECFWSSTSPASLRMLAVLQRLRGEIGTDLPSIVCLNLDSDPVAFRRASAACAGDLVSVHAGPPMQGEMPATLPIVRVLDASGRVRRVHFGWRASLAELVRSVTGPAARSHRR